MINFVSNLIKKFKKATLQPSQITSNKSDSKHDLISSDSISINEKVKGNVYCLKEVTVDKEGDVTGNIHSKSCIVNGNVNGNILSVEYLEVKNTAIIEGNIKSGSIQIEAGSMINGFISIDKKIKLPVIIRKMSEELSERLDNSKTYLTEDLYTTIKKSPLIKEAEIPEIIQEAETIIVEPNKKIEVIRESPLKKNNTNSSNDSWW